MKNKKHFWIGSLPALALAILVASAVAMVPARPAQAAGSYQLPCAPYDSPYYAFGQYVSGWGYHAGEDTCDAAGTPVYATADGQVVYSAKTPDSYRWGNLILIQHANGDGSQVTSLYGHLSGDRRVSAGQSVAKGQLIGFVGPSWTADNGNWSAHLHFGIRYGGYNAAIGTYAPGIVGYVASNVGGSWAKPSDYVGGRQVTYDYQPVNATGGGASGKNAEYYVDFNLRNTGSTTWKTNGEGTVKLGTSSGQDRASGFSLGQAGHGWSSANRIAMLADTAPGQTATFRARFSNRAINPGRYVERFTPVVEGQGWLADRGVSVTVDVQPAVNRAQWVGQAAYTDLSPTNTANPTDASYLLPGQKLNLKAYIRNVGDSAWTKGGANPTRLANTKPTDRGSVFATGGNGSIPTSENWPGYNRPSELDGRYEASNNSITQVDWVNPGETAVFSFTITVPNQPGNYAEYFNPVIEGKQWLNDLGMYFPLRVLQPGYHYEFAGQQNPSAIPLGGGGSVGEVYLRNVGQSDWPVNSSLKLGTDRGRDRHSDFKGADWQGANRASPIDDNATNPGKGSISPGEVAKFGFTVDNQKRPDGVHPEYFRPVMEGVTWLPEDYGMFVPVTVQSPTLEYQVLSQDFDRPIDNLRYGDTAVATLAVRNMGKQNWATGGANPVRLGTSSPLDRLSGFAVLSGDSAWPSLTRASSIDGRVTSLSPLSVVPANEIKQGEIAFFKVPIKVPAGVNPGSYQERFNLVIDGQTWLPDRGIYFPFQILGS